MKVISFLLDLLYPPRCAFCHDFLETSRETATIDYNIRCADDTGVLLYDDF